MIGSVVLQNEYPNIATVKELSKREAMGKQHFFSGEGERLLTLHCGQYNMATVVQYG